MSHVPRHTPVVVMLAALVLAVPVSPTFAVEPLAFDTSFTTDGWTSFDVGAAGAEGFGARDAVLAGRGVVLVGGDDGSDVTVLRVRANGTLDPGFGGGDGITQIDLGGTDVATSVAVDADGRIVVAGSAAGQRPFVARLSGAGLPDPSFGYGGVVTFRRGGGATDVAVAPSGRIAVVTGDATRVWVLRLMTDGSLDDGFGGGDGRVSSTLGGGSPELTGVAVDGKGRVLAAGHVIREGGTRDVVGLRLRRDGGFDPSFSGNGIAVVDLGGWDDTGEDIALQPDGRVVIAGATSPSGDADRDPLLVRLLADGSPDASFGANGRRRVGLGRGPDAFAGVAVEPDGDIVATGETDGDLLVASATPDGTRVTYRIKDIDGGPDRGASIAVRPDDRLWVAGTFTVEAARHYGLARLFPA